MEKVLAGIGAFHRELIESFVRGFFLEGRLEAAAAIARAYRSEEGQAVLWENGSPRAFESSPWFELLEMGKKISP